MKFVAAILIVLILTTTVVKSQVVYYDTAYSKYPVTIDYKLPAFKQYLKEYWLYEGKGMYRVKDTSIRMTKQAVFLEWYKEDNACWWE